MALQAVAIEFNLMHPVVVGGRSRRVASAGSTNSGNGPALAPAARKASLLVTYCRCDLRCTRLTILHNPNRAPRRSRPLSMEPRPLSNLEWL
jgi:hypothetical protein